MGELVTFPGIRTVQRSPGNYLVEPVNALAAALEASCGKRPSVIYLDDATFEQLHQAECAYFNADPHQRSPFVFLGVELRPLSEATNGPA